MRRARLPPPLGAPPSLLAPLFLSSQNFSGHFSRGRKKGRERERWLHSSSPPPLSRAPKGKNLFFPFPPSSSLSPFLELNSKCIASTRLLSPFLPIFYSLPFPSSGTFSCAMMRKLQEREGRKKKWQRGRNCRRGILGKNAEKTRLCWRDTLKQ